MEATLSSLAEDICVVALEHGVVHEYSKELICPFYSICVVGSDLSDVLDCWVKEDFEEI